jgi:monoamine oxidase
VHALGLIAITQRAGRVATVERRVRWTFTSMGVLSGKGFQRCGTFLAGILTQEEPNDGRGLMLVNRDQSSPSSYAISPYKLGTDAYLAILEKFGSKQGFPQATKKDIAVVGTGISGLLAGFLLGPFGAGHRVHFYEASNTVGGRIKTLRDRFTSGFYAEAGAMRIPSHHKLTLGLIEAFGLSCLEFPKNCSNGNALFYINNEHSKNERDPRKLGFQVDDTEKDEKAWDLLERYIVQYLAQKEDKNSQNWSGMTFAKLNDDRALAEIERVFRKLDEYSFADFLKEAVQSNQMSDGAAKFICATLALEMSLNTSMAYMVHMLRTLFAATLLYQIRDGMDCLPKCFVNQQKAAMVDEYTKPLERVHQMDWLRSLSIDLSANIDYNTRVTELTLKQYEFEGEKITAHYENVILRQRYERRFDLVILALPFSALRHVRMKNLARQGKRQALRQLHYDNACKVLLEFKEPFWKNKHGIEGGKTITDLPVRQIFYPNKCQNNNNVLLASYTWGDDSLRWTGLSNDDRLRFALRDVSRVHGHQHDSYLRNCLLEGTLTAGQSTNIRLGHSRYSSRTSATTFLTTYGSRRGVYTIAANIRLSNMDGLRVL